MCVSEIQDFYIFVPPDQKSCREELTKLAQHVKFVTATETQKTNNNNRIILLYRPHLSLSLLSVSVVFALCSSRFFSEFSSGEASSVGPPWLRSAAHVCMCVMLRTLRGTSLHCLSGNAKDLERLTDRHLKKNLKDAFLFFINYVKLICIYLPLFPH